MSNLNGWTSGHSVSIALTVALSILLPPGASAQNLGDRFFQQTYDVPADGTLRVDLGDSDVQIRTSASAVTVEVFVDSNDPEWSQEIFERLRFQADAQGSTLTVRARDPHVSNGEWRRQRRMRVTTVVHVPQRFNLDVETGDGDVEVGDIEGNVDIRTGDGDVHMSQVRGERLGLSSSDGDLVARLVEVGQAQLRSSDGDIRVDALSGEVSVRTGDGDVDIRLTSVAETEIRTGDGDVTVYAPEPTNAEVYLEGEDVEVDMPVTLRGRVSDRRVEGRLGNGGPSLRITTGDGSVRLRSSR